MTMEIFALTWDAQPALGRFVVRNILGIFTAEREQLRRSNLLDFDGRAWTTNCHQGREALFAHMGAPDRAPPQDSLASRQMSETQN